MLQSMRQLAHSWVVKGLMLFLAISFSIWGIGDIFRGNPQQKTVASVGNTSISVQDLNRSFEKTLALARKKLSPDLTAQQARQLGLLDKTLEEEVQRNLVDQEVKRLGLNVPQDTVLKLVGEQPQFRSKDGTFNKALFLQFLQQQGLNEHSFVSKEQEDLAHEILLAALSSGQSVPQTEVDALFRARARKHVLDVVTLDSSKIGGIPAPDDKALHDFYDHNASEFAAPEYRSLTIALLSTDALAKDIVFSDEQLKKVYDAKIDELSHPEQRDIVQVVVQDEDKAKQLTTQARTSNDLEATAKLNKEAAVPLENMEEKHLMPELSKVVFTLKDNGVSDPVKTQLGWHVVQVKKITPPGKPSFESVKETLRSDLQRDQAIEAATRIVNQLDDQLAAGHALDDIADGLKLRLVKIPAVDDHGLTAEGKQPPEFPNKDEVLKESFGQNAGETSPVEDDKAGNYYVVRTDEITPAATKPFDQVKDLVAKAWKLHAQAAKALTIAGVIEKDLRAGKPAYSFEGQEGVSVRTSSPLTQLGDTDPLLPKDLVMQALKLKQGETTSTAADGKQIVVRVVSITDADASKPDPRRGMVALQIKQTSADELFDQYMKHLQGVFTVKTNRTLLEQLRQQDSGQ